MPETPTETALREWVTNEPNVRHEDDMPAYWEWRSKFAEGPPKATERYPVADLERMGMIGLYRIIRVTPEGRAAAEEREHG